MSAFRTSSLLGRLRWRRPGPNGASEGVHLGLALGHDERLVGERASFGMEPLMHQRRRDLCCAQGLAAFGGPTDQLGNQPLYNRHNRRVEPFVAWRLTARMRRFANGEAANYENRNWLATELLG